MENLNVYLVYLQSEDELADWPAHAIIVSKDEACAKELFIKEHNKSFKNRECIKDDLFSVSIIDTTKEYVHEYCPVINPA